MRRIALPLILTTSLIAGALAAVAGSAQNASAAATVGTFTVGANAIQLNQPSDPEIGVLTPTADAATNGMFGPQVAWPVIPLEAVLTRSGHLVTFGTPLDSDQQGGLVYDDWDTTAGLDRSSHTDTPSMENYNSFCNSFVTIDDGRILMVGGNSDQSTMLYDPNSRAEVMGQNINSRRWYSTSLRLPDGRILVMGGADAYNSSAFRTPDTTTGVAMTPEIGTGTGAWTPLTGATSAYAFGPESNRWWYPRAFNGPNNTVVGMSGDHIWTLVADTQGSVQPYGTLPFNPGVSGSQVMYAPGKILVAGGGQRINDDPVQATNQAAVVDVTGLTAVATSIAPMTYPRNWLNLTVLPTGEVLANGGTKFSTDGGDDNSVKQAEMWNPTTGQWRTLASAQRTRTYHSVSLVLPSGAVFTGGGGAPGPESNLNAELYFPSYLFSKGADGSVQWASRPAISSISGSAAYGGTVRLGIGDGRAIGSVSLISSPAVTHGQNTDQRRIPLDFTQNGGTVSATLPTSMSTMPAGDYELTVVDTKGVPSAAQIITIRRDGAGLVTVAPQTQTKDPGAPASGPGTSTPGAGSGTGAGTGAGAGTGTGEGSGPGAGAGTGLGGGSNALPTGGSALTIDRSVGLEAGNRTGYRITHTGSAIGLGTIGDAPSTSARQRASWAVRTGLASSSAISFESVDHPGYYLVAPTKGSGALRLAKNDRSKRFALRATFSPTKGLTGKNTSFHPWTDRSLAVRHLGTALVVQKPSTSASGKADGTFLVRTAYAAAPAVPLSAGRSIGLGSVDEAGYRIRHSGSRITLGTVGVKSSSSAKSSASWIVRAGLSGKGGVSFESVDRPGWFLVAPTKGTGALTLVKRTGSSSFKARATFTATKGVTGTNISFRLKAHQELVVHRSGNALRLDKVGTSPAARVGATFVVYSGSSPAPTR